MDLMPGFLEIALYVVVVASVLFLTVLAGIVVFTWGVTATLALYGRFLEPPVNWFLDRYDLKGAGKNRLLRRLLGSISWTSFVVGATLVAVGDDDAAMVCLVVAVITGIWWVAVPHNDGGP